MKAIPVRPESHTITNVIVHLNGFHAAPALPGIGGAFGINIIFIFVRNINIAVIAADFGQSFVFIDTAGDSLIAHRCSVV